VTRNRWPERIDRAPYPRGEALCLHTAKLRLTSFARALKRKELRDQLALIVWQSRRVWWPDIGL